LGDPATGGTAAAGTAWCTRAWALWVTRMRLCRQHDREDGVKLFGQHHPASHVGVRDAMELGSRQDGIEARWALQLRPWHDGCMLLCAVEVLLVDAGLVWAYTGRTRHETYPPA
jgi:hypothetical protein